MSVRKSAVLLFVVLTLVAQAVAAQDTVLAAYRKAIEKRIRESQADVAISFLTLDGKTQYLYRADDSFHAASTMKIPVMIELFHQVKERRLRLTDTLTIHNQFHSIVDNSPYSLDPNDDSEKDLYDAEGETRELGFVCELMITKSSNLATNLLIERLGVEDIRATVRSLGADGMHVLRGVEDQKAYQQGLNNTTTARALQVLLTDIAEGEVVDEDSCRAMIAILEKQAFNEGIPAGLPVGTRVAHKTGEITNIHHDAAIVYAPRPFVLVVLVRGITDQKDSATLIADITKMLYQAVE